MCGFLHHQTLRAALLAINVKRKSHQGNQLSPHTPSHISQKEPLKLRRQSIDESLDVIRS
jgi:hypothetical protein